MALQKNMAEPEPPNVLSKMYFAPEAPVDLEGLTLVAQDYGGKRQTYDLDWEERPIILRPGEALVVSLGTDGVLTVAKGAHAAR